MTDPLVPNKTMGLRLFHCGGGAVAERLVVKGGSRRKQFLPFLAWLLEHPDHGPILVDAPLSHRGTKSFPRIVGGLFNLLGRIEFRESWGVAARLGEMGVKVADVEHGILTHMHLDHTGGMPEMVSTTWYPSQPEWTFIQELSGLAKLQATAAYVFDDWGGETSRRIAPVTWSGPVLAPFGPCADVFGDGSVLAVPLPGHSAGHQGVFFNTKEGPVLIAGDAAFDRRHLEGRELGLMPTSFAWQNTRCLATLDRLREFHAQRPDVRIMLSHDAEDGESCRQGPIEIG